MTGYDRDALAERLRALAPRSPSADWDWDTVLDRARASSDGAAPSRSAVLRRSRRRRLAVAGAVALAVAVGSAAAYGIHALIYDRGIIGPPPPGAIPSIPKRGQLVLEIVGRRSGGSDPRLLAARVYADGRVIWRRQGDFSYGANSQGTGWLEQRLTPDGVERIRSEVISTGLFDRNLQLKGGSLWGFVRARRGDRLVRLEWSGGCCSDFGGTRPTDEQLRQVYRLNALLVNPRRWLPASAWKDPKIKAYVPSRFAVCYGTGNTPKPGRSRILAALPPLARDLLRGKDLLKPLGPRGPSSYCSAVSAQDARMLEKAFNSAENMRVRKTWLLEFTLEVPRPMNSVRIEFEPIFPDGEWGCSGCG